MYFHNYGLPTLKEIIELPGYTLTEKIRIAQSHLLPKQIKAHGLDTAAPLSLSPTLLTIIIQDHTREAGVRQLERHLAAICRFEAIQTAQKQDVEELSVTVLETILGVCLPILQRPLYLILLASAV